MYQCKNAPEKSKNIKNILDFFGKLSQFPPRAPSPCTQAQTATSLMKQNPNMALKTVCKMNTEKEAMQIQCCSEEHETK